MDEHVEIPKTLIRPKAVSEQHLQYAPERDVSLQCLAAMSGLEATLRESNPEELSQKVFGGELDGCATMAALENMGIALVTFIAASRGQKYNPDGPWGPVERLQPFGELFAEVKAVEHSEKTLPFILSMLGLEWLSFVYYGSRQAMMMCEAGVDGFDAVISQHNVVHFSLSGLVPQSDAISRLRTVVTALTDCGVTEATMHKIITDVISERS